MLKRDDDLGDCLNLAEMIPQSSIRYDVNDQRLDIDVPRAWIMKNYQNYVDPLCGKMALMQPCFPTTSMDITVKVQAEQMTVSTRHSTVG